MSGHQSKAAAWVNNIKPVDIAYTVAFVIKSDRTSETDEILQAVMKVSGQGLAGWFFSPGQGLGQHLKGVAGHD